MTHTKRLKVLRFKKHSLNLGDLIHERQSLIKFIAAAVSLRFHILRHLALHSTNCNRHTFNQQLLVGIFFISVPFANISPSIATWAMKRNQLSIPSVALSLLRQSSCHHNLKTLWHVTITLWCFVTFIQFTLHTKYMSIARSNFW